MRVSSFAQGELEPGANMGVSELSSIGVFGRSVVAHNSAGAVGLASSSFDPVRRCEAMKRRKATHSNWMCFPRKKRNGEEKAAPLVEIRSQFG
jgi:hypothetical protein